MGINVPVKSGYFVGLAPYLDIPGYINLPDQEICLKKDSLPDKPIETGSLYPQVCRKQCLQAPRRSVTVRTHTALLHENRT